MEKQTSKVSLDHLPIMNDSLISESYSFRKKPVEIVELAFITQNTTSFKACYPFKLQEVVAVIGRSSENCCIYFCQETLKGNDGKVYAGANAISSMNVTEIDEYEPLKRFMVKNYKL